MAKADPTRDYYADLGLTPGADITEINKQYRKLGTSTVRRSSVSQEEMN